MKITIDKSKSGGYTLTLKSGHFCGTLDNISKEDLTGLKSGIESLLDDKDKHSHTMVWNPRARRHETIEQ